MRLERYLGTRFQENFYAFIKKLEVSSGEKKKKNKKFARKGHELMTLEAMPVTALANAGNEESLIFRVTFFRSKS